MRLCGIYRITGPHGSYIGRSYDIHLRWVQHRTQLAQGRHHSYKLQAAWTKYGPQAFTFAILEVCDSTTSVRALGLREQHHLNAQNRPLNVQLDVLSPYWPKPKLSARPTPPSVKTTPIKPKSRRAKKRSKLKNNR